jgi:phospholipase/lecithinase/hemolysin
MTNIWHNSLPKGNLGRILDSFSEVKSNFWDQNYNSKTLAKGDKWRGFSSFGNNGKTHKYFKFASKSWNFSNNQLFKLTEKFISEIDLPVIKEFIDNFLEDQGGIDALKPKISELKTLIDLNFDFLSNHSGQGKHHKPKDTLILFGDSTFDNGNLTQITKIINLFKSTPIPEPYPAPFYSKGKASNDLVLGETLAEGLGIDPDHIVTRTKQLFVDVFQDSVNYAFSGATSGEFGFKGKDLQTIPIGLLTQVEVFKKDFDLASQNYPHKNLSVDALLSVGSNDIFDVLTIANFFNVFLTPDPSDDQALIQSQASQIVNNINSALTSTGDRLDDVVIVGLSPLGNLPFVIAFDQILTQQLAQYGDVSGKTKDLLTGIAAEVNTQLKTKYDNPLNDVKDVFVIDGFQALDQALQAWKNSLGGLIPIEGISYLDYKTLDTGLPANLSVQQFAFVDGAHPTAQLNHLIADQIVPMILAEFPDFSAINANCNFV